jgi:hypothetical protein
MISAHSARETTAQDEGGSGKKEKGGGKGRESRSSPARLQRPRSDIETQNVEVDCRPSLFGVWCACAGPKSPVVAR